MDVNGVMNLIYAKNTAALSKLTPTVDTFSTIIRAQMLYKACDNTALYDFALKHFGELDNIERDLTLMYFNSLYYKGNIDALNDRYCTGYFCHHWTAILLVLANLGYSWQYIYSFYTAWDIPTSIVVDMYALLEIQNKSMVTLVKFGLTVFKYDITLRSIPAHVMDVATLFGRNNNKIPANHVLRENSKYIVEIHDTLEYTLVPDYTRNTDLTFIEYASNIEGSLSSDNWYAPEYLPFLKARRTEYPKKILAMIAVQPDTLDQIYLHSRWMNTQYSKLVYLYDTKYKITPWFTRYPLYFMLLQKFKYKDSIQYLIDNCKYKTSLSMLYGEALKKDLCEYGIDDYIILPAFA
jgi:hypothetical protein